ncbi:MAG: transcriptional regulator [Acidimicrobiales bacterium]
MPHPSDPDLLLLLGMRLKNFVEPDVLADMWALDATEVGDRLGVLADEGLAQHRDGRVSGWALTAEGRAEGERRLTSELEATGTRDAIDASYRRFLALNRTFLAVCTRWQVKDPENNLLNEHDDADYDAAVVAELVDIDNQVQPICSDLADTLDRFESIGPRFAGALDRVQKGENEWFAKPLIDSYHTVWFDLHETLLASLGIDRASEADNAEGSH